MSRCPLSKLARPAMLVALVGSALPLAAFAQANISSTQEEYQIYRWRTSAPKREMIAATTRPLLGYASGWQTATPIVMGPPPQTAGHFALTNPFDNPRFGMLAGLAAMGGGAAMSTFKVATCDGAVWIGTIQRDLEGSQKMQMTACLYPSATGYDLDLYDVDYHQHGGGLSQIIGRAVVDKIMGSPTAWKDRMIDAVVASISQAAGSPATYVEGQPDRSEAAVH